MNLPKHIEQCLDDYLGEIPERAKYIIDHTTKDGCCIMCGHPDNPSMVVNRLKQLITQILEEEKEKIILEISKQKTQVGMNLYPSEKEFYRNKIIDSIINLIKK